MQGGVGETEKERRQDGGKMKWRCLGCGLRRKNTRRRETDRPFGREGASGERERDRDVGGPRGIVGRVIVPHE